MTHIKGTKGSKNRQSRPDFDLAGLLSRKIIECRTCNTRLYRNKDFGITFYMEEWTNTIHDKRRCIAIMEQRKRAKYDPNAPRLEVVEDLRDIIITLPIGTPLPEQVYHVIKSRKDPDESITMKELAMALKPEQVYVDKNGIKQPTRESYSSATGALNRLRRMKENSNIVPFSVKFVDGQWRIWNIQTEEEFKPVLKRRNKMIEGIELGTKMAQEIIDLGVIKRGKEEKKMDALLTAKKDKKGVGIY
jgi:hypothetical protein